MLRTTHILLTTALAAGTLATGAGAASQHLGGQPQLKGEAGEKTAVLQFAADEAPDKITFAGGQKAGTAKKAGKHGSDTKYRVTVTSSQAFRATKYTVSFRFDDRTETRKVSFKPAG